MAQRSSRRSEYTDPWWRKDYGGMPGWAVSALILVIAAIGVASLFALFR